MGSQKSISRGGFQVVMAGKEITLTIAKLAGLGDGVAEVKGKKIFVPLTVAGDVVAAEITRRTQDADYARLLRVVTPGPDRAPAPCKHYGQCGGCSLQHMAAPAYNEFKAGMVGAAVRRAGYDPACVTPMISFSPASRRRVELKYRAGQWGYFEQRSHQLAGITQCIVLEPALEALVLQLPKTEADIPGVESVQINAVDGGYDLLFTGKQRFAWAAPMPDSVRRVALSVDGKIHTLSGASEVTLTLGGVKISPPPGAFQQAVLAAQEAITQRILAATQGAKLVLDVFCGQGTYSLPLARHSAVEALEGDAAMVEALREAAAKASLPLKAFARDLFKSPLNARELARFDAVVINPPRAGAAAQSQELAQSAVPKIIMVSCNPATFARDAKTLREGGYNLARVTPIDQFHYTPHVELVAEFSRP